MAVLTATAPESGARPGLGFAGFLELVGDDPEFLAEFTTLFDQDSRRLVAGALEASAGLDAASLEKSAHALKGLLSHFGESAALELCRRLEALARGRDLAGAEALTLSLAAEVDLVRRALARLAP